MTDGRVNLIRAAANRDAAVSATLSADFALGRFWQLCGLRADLRKGYAGCRGDQHAHRQAVEVGLSQCRSNARGGVAVGTVPLRNSTIDP